MRQLVFRKARSANADNEPVSAALISSRSRIRNRFWGTRIKSPSAAAAKKWPRLFQDWSFSVFHQPNIGFVN
jgi:hypothetical protein